MLPGSSGCVAHQGGWSQDACGLLNEGWGAADGAGDARALVKGAGLEGLAIVVVHTVQITTHGHHVWKWSH